MKISKKELSELYDLAWKQDPEDGDLVEIETMMQEHIVCAEIRCNIEGKCIYPQTYLTPAEYELSLSASIKKLTVYESEEDDTEVSFEYEDYYNYAEKIYQ